jgi:hypothetical protein
MNCKHDYEVTGGQFCTICGLSQCLAGFTPEELAWLTPERMEAGFRKVKNEIQWQMFKRRKNLNHPLGDLAVKEWGQYALRKARHEYSESVWAYQAYILNQSASLGRIGAL